MRCDRRKRRILYNPLLDEMDMVRPVEDVESESRSQNGLQGIDVDDPAREKAGTMVSLEKPGTPVEEHSTGCLYHKQTVSITTVTVKR